MIKVICIIFAITIKDLKLHLSTLNLLLGKNTIKFKLLVPKKKTVK